VKSTASPAATRVAKLLLDGGQATASGLASSLGLTPTAIRRHLDALVDLGYAQFHDRAPFGPTPLRGRGRPARIYTLTDAGRDAFDQAYDDLAISALRFVSETLGEQGVIDFARARAEEMERRYSEQMNPDASPAQRVAELAQQLSDDGFSAGTEPVANGVQVCQHHCPVAQVAVEFPQLCDAEAEIFGRLTGTHATRLATLSHGDGVCTTHIPLSAPSERTSA